MFIFLSKFLPPWVYPLGLAMLLILLGLLLRRKAIRNAALIAALLVIFLGGNRWVAAAIARSLEWRYLPPAETPHAEVIVLLAGGALPAEAPRQTVEVTGAGDRMIYAAALYRLGAAPVILLSGGTIEWINPEMAVDQDMAGVLEFMGVPRSAMWFEPDSRNTYESAVAVRTILEGKGIRRIILVTSASHMPRSVALFEKQGFEVIPAPTDFSVTIAGWERLTHGGLESTLLSLLPSGENMAWNYLNLKEYLGIFIYKLNGWL
jgi:uncharacterized SAM-binding protein YcdF (DUF218 family)